MYRLSIAAITGFVAMVAVSGSLLAKPALKDVAQVREGIIAVGIAYEISENCGSLSPRYIRGWQYLEGLKKVARDLGYNRREIDAYIDDSDEKRRLEAIARERMAAMGVVAGDEASHCAVGLAEMRAQSVIGRLLR